jgi:hypothetical protein
MKGWSYHLLPVTAFSFLGVLAAILTGGRPGLGSVSLCGMLMLPVMQGLYRNPTAEVLARAIQSRAQNSAIFVFSSYVWVGFPLATMVKARWPSRFPTLWTLPGAEKQIASARAIGGNDQLGPLLRLEQYTIDSVVEDFRKDMPALVIVDRRVDPRFGNVKFDYVQFFEQDSRFSEIWSEYVWDSRIEQDGIGPYDLYVRTSVTRPHTDNGLANKIADLQSQRSIKNRSLTESTYRGGGR